MAWAGLGSDLGRTSFALGQGVRNASERGETPATFNYTAGSPGQLADPTYGTKRFAGDIFQGKGVHSEDGGEFAVAIADKKNRRAQDGMEKFVNEWTSGPWSPFDMGPEEGIPQEETA